MKYTAILETYLSPIDRIITHFHKKIYQKYTWKAIISSLLFTLTILVLFHEDLKISCNYFILFPLVSSALAYGLLGGLIAGVSSLPLNLLFFDLVGHPEYAPESQFIAFNSGLFVGLIMGYLSDYFKKLTAEVDRRVKTEARLRDSLSEKDLLLKEINHRVRNNLGIISSIIQLQSNKIENPYFTAEFQKLKQRIFSISLVHEQLFMENQPLVLDIRDYLESLLQNILGSSNSNDIEFKMQKPDSPLYLDGDKVLHLGLLVQEVVMNSLKYAFPAPDKGIISLNLSKKDQNIIITIHDSGDGFDPDHIKKGLGSRLIDTLALSLDAEYSWSKRDGCLFTFIFPVYSI